MASNKNVYSCNVFFSNKAKWAQIHKDLFLTSLIRSIFENCNHISVKLKYAEMVT